MVPSFIPYPYVKSEAGLGLSGRESTPRPGSPPTLLLYLSSFLVAFGVNLYSPFIPLYLRELGACYFEVGLVGAAFSAPYIFLPVLVGLLSDRLGRAGFYVAGVVCSVSAPILLYHASEVLHVLLVRLYTGVGYSLLWPVVEAMLTDLTGEGERVKAMSRYSFSWALGFLLAPGLGGILNDTVGFRQLLTISFTSSLPAVLLSALAVRGAKHGAYQPHTQSVRVQALITLYSVVLAYSSCLGLLVAVFPAYAEHIGLSTPEIGFMFTSLGIARLTTLLLSERVFKTLGPSALSLALLAQASALMLIYRFKEFIILLTAFAVEGFALGVLAPLSLSTLSLASPRLKAGLTLGFAETMFGLGVTLGPLAGGLLSEAAGLRTPYFFHAVVTMIPVFVMLAWGRLLPKPSYRSRV